MLQQDQEHLRLLQTENINLRNLLCETRGRLRPLPLAMHPEDHEDDTLPARIDAALDDDTLPARIDAKGAGDRVRNVLLSAARVAQNGEQGRREHLGRIVREEWIKWAREQPNPKPSWLVPWEGLNEPDKEVDRRIGVRLYSIGVLSGLALLEEEEAPIGSVELAITDGEIAEVERTYGERVIHGPKDGQGPHADWQIVAMRALHLAHIAVEDLRRTRTVRNMARASALTYQLDAENALKIAAEESDAADHDDAIIMHNAPIRAARWRQTRRERDRLHDLCEQIQDDIDRALDRARAINTQAEAVMRQNVEMLAAMERSSDPTMRQLATEIRRRT